MDALVQMDWERCVAFHGHICPGLAIGFQAAQIALKVLTTLDGEPDNPQSGIVSIVQNDACGVDAVQVLTGCTFGKGNLFFMDHGKQVFSFVRRQDGRGVRVAMKYGAMDNERHQALRAKMMKKTATQAETEEFNTNMAKDFKAEIEKLKGEDIDIAFFPVDNRLKEHYYLGGEYFIENLAPKLFIPMHFGDSPEITKDFFERYKNSKTKIAVINERGQEILY